MWTYLHQQHQDFLRCFKIANRVPRIGENYQGRYLNGYCNQYFSGPCQIHTRYPTFSLKKLWQHDHFLSLLCIGHFLLTCARKLFQGGPGAAVCTEKFVTPWFMTPAVTYIFWAKRVYIVWNFTKFPRLFPHETKRRTSKTLPLFVNHYVANNVRDLLFSMHHYIQIFSSELATVAFSLPWMFSFALKNTFLDFDKSCKGGKSFPRPHVELSTYLYISWFNLQTC